MTGPTTGGTAQEQHMVAQIEGLAAQVKALFPDEKRFQVTWRLLEAAAWRITYQREPESP